MLATEIAYARDLMLRGRLLALFVLAVGVFAVACAEDFAVTEPEATSAATTSRSPAAALSPEESPTPAADAVSVGVSVFIPGVSTGTPLATVDPLTTEHWGQVIDVVDGDTVDLMVAGEERRVRLILIDTPEVYGGAECYGAEASARAGELLPAGSMVELIRDVSETDRYGRLLRYVYLGDGRMLNEVLVAEGFATLSTYPPDIAEVDRIRNAQTEAREAGRGLWSACDAAPAPVIPGPVTQSGAAAGCDPSYPTVCIPPYPPDLDCGHISNRRFDVVGADPHGFDRDRDGIGCEG